MLGQMNYLKNKTHHLDPRLTPNATINYKLKKRGMDALVRPCSKNKRAETVVQW